MVLKEELLKLGMNVAEILILEGIKGLKEIGMKYVDESKNSKYIDTRDNEYHILSIKNYKEHDDIDNEDETNKLKKAIFFDD